MKCDILAYDSFFYARCQNFHLKIDEELGEIVLKTVLGIIPKFDLILYLF